MKVLDLGKDFRKTPFNSYLRAIVLVVFTSTVPLKVKFCNRPFSVAGIITLCPVSTVTSLQDAGMQLQDQIAGLFQLPEFKLIIAPLKTAIEIGELLALVTDPTVQVAV